MVKRIDPFWNDVEDMNDGSMKCKFCGHLFAERTSIWRIKCHLSGETGRGVGICGLVPKEVQEQAILAIQGKVDQASVIPHIDNMQQESLVPRNAGRSTRSQMENLQVHVLQNQTARPNASDAGPESSLQSQERGLNSQQVQRAGSRDPFWNYVVEKDDGSMICLFCRRRWAKKIPISRFKWHLSGEEGRNVKICSGVTKEVQEEALKAMHGSNKRHKSTACSINLNDRGISTFPQEQNIENENMGGDIGRVQRENLLEAREGEERISSYEVARNNIVSMTGMRAQEDRVSEGAFESRLVTEPVDLLDF